MRNTFIIFSLLMVTSLTAAVTQKAWVEIRTDNQHRIIRSNGLANHKTGQFPNRRNPNRITAQNYSFRSSINPKVQAIPQPVKNKGVKYIFGIALNGVIFDPATAEFWEGNPRSGWNYEALSGKVDLGLDGSHAHVQPNGAYHYHGIPTALVQQLTDQKTMILIGYAADGFPIYAEYGYSDPDNPNSRLEKMRPSFRLKKGPRPSGSNSPGGTYDGIFTEDWVFEKNAGDLDICNGRFGVTPEFLEGTYHYFITSTFPFIPRYFRGTPDETFAKQRREQGPGIRHGNPPSHPKHRKHPSHPPHHQKSTP